MTYHEAEQFLLSLSNMPRKEYMEDTNKTEKYLDRLRYFLGMLGNPEKSIPHCIHVAGTSGKGSVATFLSSILAASGKKTGLMLSPHASRLLERWQVNGRTMTEKEFVRIIERLKPPLDRYEAESPYDALSYFELVTAIGFVYFEQMRVSWAVVEVGCGGRLDATNVLPKKDIAVITTIGLDHTEVLGDTKEKIAKEKAGIISSGCAVFTMERNAKVLQVIEKECRKNRAALSHIMYHVSHITSDANGTAFAYNGRSYHLPAPGAHQAYNAALCIDIARHLKIPDRAVQKGLAAAAQPLRMELVSKKPLIILDGAHNPDKIKTTVRTTLHLIRQRGSRVRLVLGFSSDKNIPAMLRRLAALSPVSVACTRQTANAFRKVAPPGDIAKQMRRLAPDADIRIFLDPKEAFRWSKKKMTPWDVLLVTGSIFLSGQLRGRVTRRPRPQE